MVLQTGFPQHFPSKQTSDGLRFNVFNDKGLQQDGAHQLQVGLQTLVTIFISTRNHSRAVYISTDSYLLRGP